MFVYLSKRIAIPNGTNITSIGWNEEQGWLACGGKNGLLKVLKVDGGSQGQKSGGLTLNQTLEGHQHAVTNVSWNLPYRKLTSCDASGSIIVWKQHKGMWFEEMVNNRHKSSVVDLSWNVEGTKVCIAYEDGAVIVGGVDGNRLWGRELNMELACVCWSPDDCSLLLGTKTGEICVHDVTDGKRISQVNIVCELENTNLVGLLWHPAWVERPEPLATLSICYSSGQVQLMNGVGDEKPYRIDTGIPVQFAAWNPQGTTLAVCGLAQTNTPESSVVVTQFFSHEGIHLRTLRVAGKHTGGITWEGDGLRVAIAVDSSVYFANVRPDYKYCYFKKTLVFSFNRPDKIEDSVMFWNIKTNERSVKHVCGLLYLNANKDACVMVSRPEESQQQQSMVQLLNSIGSPIETRLVDLEMYVCDMNSSQVVCCGEENIYIWQFRDPSVVVDVLDPVSVQASRMESRERIIHVDDVVRHDTEPTMTTRSALTNDLICAVCLSEKYMIVGRESGSMQIYRLDPLQLVAVLILPSRALKLALNCDSTLLSVIDLAGVLHIYSVEKEKFSLVPRKAEPLHHVERKDVWGFHWASDAPNMFAVLEKTRLFIFKDLEPEEPVQSCAYICKFKSLSIRTVQFDELMLDPERPRKEYIVDVETLPLRDMREVLQESSLKDAYAYVDENPHDKLWSLLAEHALMKLNFTYAEMAFIRCRDYPAIQFVKRVRSLDDARKQEAEVQAYYRHFEEAEQMYKDMDRKDLALELRNRLGDWFGVVRLVQEGGGDDTLMLKAWESIGDQYADRQKWTKASQYYTQCRNYRKLAHVFYIVEDFEMLFQLIGMAEHDNDLLMMLGRLFLSVGLAEEATQAFLSANEPRMAVDSCVEVNLWDKAIALAEEHRLTDVEKLLDSYAQYLIKRDRLTVAIELFRKAGQHQEAAKLLAQLGQRAALTDPLKAKKFYVLSALEVEQFRKKKIALSKDGAEVVKDLLTSDHTSISERTLDSAWRGAEAYHFFLMCQRQILAKNVNAALVLAMRLTDYDDLIAPVDAYSLIALTAYLAGNMGICSKAFTRLEAAERNDEMTKTGAPLQLLNFTMDLDITQKTMASTALGLGSTSAGGGGAALSGTTTALQLTNPAKGVSRTAESTYPTVNIKEPVRRFADLAVQIFTTHQPQDTSVDSVQCTNCGTFNKEWASSCMKCSQTFSMCIITGCAIISDADAWQCHVCRHKAIEVHADRYGNCPLCHTPKKRRTQRNL